jgi:hypothetical protein
MLIRQAEEKWVLSQNLGKVLFMHGSLLEESRVMLDRFGSAALLDRAGFGGDIDSDRAPGNAPPASNTPECPELVDPVGQFVHHPLAVTSSGAHSNITASNLCEVTRET